MVRISIILLLVIAAALVIWQNWLPQLSLAFLGFQSLSLPLGAWVVIAVALGILTGLLLQSLAASSPQRRFFNGARPKRRLKWPKRKPTQSFRQSTAPRVDSDWYATPARDWTDAPRTAPSDYVSRTAEGQETSYDPEPYLEDEADEDVVDADYRVLGRSRPEDRSRSDDRPRDDWDDEFFED